jgi:predicted transcriptional regulator
MSMHVSTESGAGSEILGLVTDLVSAYVANNSVPAADLPTLIDQIHGSLVRLGAPVEPEPVKLDPPVAIKRSITPDYLISLEDGRPYKSLKRHLRKYGMTPDDYRKKWGLSSNYPMVAANYAEARSQLAKNMGLGQMNRKKQ